VPNASAPEKSPDMPAVSPAVSEDNVNGSESHATAA
jgi:hypothetical protein